MQKTVIILLSTLFSISVNANIIACEKGMVKEGDSFETVVKKCGKNNNFQTGMKNYKKKKSDELVVFKFKKYKKVLADGNHINFIFIEDQLMFITD